MKTSLRPPLETLSGNIMVEACCSLPRLTVAALRNYKKLKKLRDDAKNIFDFRFPDDDFSQLRISSSKQQGMDKWPENQSGVYWWSITCEEGTNKDNFGWKKDNSRWPDKQVRNRYWFSIVSANGVEIPGFYWEVESKASNFKIGYQECGGIQEWLKHYYEPDDFTDDFSTVNRPYVTGAAGSLTLSFSSAQSTLQRLETVPAERSSPSFFSSISSLPTLPHESNEVPLTLESIEGYVTRALADFEQDFVNKHFQQEQQCQNLLRELREWRRELTVADTSLEIQQKKLNTRLLDLQQQATIKERDLQTLRDKLDKMEKRITLQGSQNFEIGKLQGEIARLQLELDPIRHEYEAKRTLQAQKQYLMQHNSLAIRRFYMVLQAKLNGIFSALMILNYSGLVKASDNGLVSPGVSVLEKAGKAVTRGFGFLGYLSHGNVLFAGVIIDLLACAALAGVKEYEKTKRERAGEVLPITPETNTALAEETARLLTYRYEETLVKLTEKSAEILAINAINKIMMGLYGRKLSKKSHQAIPAQLMILVSQLKTKHQRKFDCKLFEFPLLGQQKLETIAGDEKVKDENIFRRKTGIKFIAENGNIFFYRSTNQNQKLTKYGFRWGDGDEKQQLDLPGSETVWIEQKTDSGKYLSEHVITMAKIISQAKLDMIPNVHANINPPASVNKELLKQGRNLGDMQDKIEVQAVLNQQGRLEIQKMQEKIQQLENELNILKETQKKSVGQPALRGNRLGYP